MANRPEQPLPTGSDSPADQAKRLRLAETLVQVSRTVAAMETLDDVLATLVDLTTRETGADRGTLFLNDPATGELYSRVAQGHRSREIRFPNDVGIAGHVFQTGMGLIVNDAYGHPKFNPEIDEQTGYRTERIVCAPIRTARGTVIGVAQVLNKQGGAFTDEELSLVEQMTTQAAVALMNSQYVESMERKRSEELQFLELVSDITSELDLGALLQRIMGEATRLLKADRSTLFLNDERSGQLFARVAQGDSLDEIRFPNTVGIAGTVFTTGETINIPYAYADLRFNPGLDKQTGYFTRSILCVPVVNNDGETIGVTQVLNKRGGPFTAEDEQRLKAFTAQVSIALQNAKLFDDVQTMKNYTEAMLESMSNGVLTLDEDGRIATCNAAGARILRSDEAKLVTQPASPVLSSANPLLTDMVERVAQSQSPDLAMDLDLTVGDEDETVSVNATVLPLISADAAKLGTMVMLEDISGEKRVRSTMARYMDPGLADQLVRRDEELLGGKNLEATIMFSDIRRFTTVAEELGPQGTVALLNDYFTIMVEAIQSQGGMLDKFIGDAIMAVFGLPVPHGDDTDRGVRAAISMITSLFDWNQHRVSEGRMPIDMGIGLNTDLVVAGNIGSPKRMDFTIIGDGVNLASRLESACKQYSARILISEHTFGRLKGVYRTREVDYVIVKGKTEPVGVYEILDYHTNETFPNLMDAVNCFRDGIEKYRRGDWDQAVAAFGEALKANPDDQLSQTYIERCAQLVANPPAVWDGVWAMTSK